MMKSGSVSELELSVVSGGEESTVSVGALSAQPTRSASIKNVTMTLRHEWLIGEAPNV